MEADNVVELKLITKLDLDPDKILKKTIGKLQDCVIVGYDHEGNEFFASSKADAAEVIFRLERAKHTLLKIIDEMGS